MVGKLLINTFYNKKKDEVMVAYHEYANDEDKTGIKKFDVVKPQFRFYTTKPGKEVDYNVLKMKIDDVDEHIVPYKELYKYIAEIRGRQDEYATLEANRNLYLAKRFNDDFNLHGSTVNVEDFEIANFNNVYSKTTNKTMTKAFFDIECDTKELGEFPKPDLALAPVALISLLFEGKMHVFMLKNPDIAEAVKIDSSKDKRYTLKKKFIKRFEGVIEDIMFYRFDTELELIVSFFALINNTLRPDICAAWNIGFDMLTLVNRLGNLTNTRGANTVNNDYTYFNDTIAKIVIPKDMYDAGFKEMYYKDSPVSDITSRDTYFKIPSYTMYLDQLYLFAMTSRGAKRDDYSLDAIGSEIAGEHKDHVDDHRTYMYRFYEKYVEYNIQDVVICYKIEKKLSHCEFVAAMSLLSNTRMERVMKKTVTIENLFRASYARLGYVLSNNRNKANIEKDIEIIKLYKLDYDSTIDLDFNGDIKGAFVLDPNNNDKVGMKVMNAISSYVFLDCEDLDFTRLYPSLMCGFDIDVDNMIAKIITKKNMVVTDTSPADELLYVDQCNVLNILETENNGEKTGEKLYELDNSIMLIDGIIAKNNIYIANEFMGLPPLENIMNMVGTMLNSTSYNSADELLSDLNR